MFQAAWSKVPHDKRRAWTLIAGAITAGTVIKVAYFKVSRGVMVSDSDRQHKEGLEHLRKAEEFSKWSHKDRVSRVPKLTTEQERQMQEYLQIVSAHGLSRSFVAANNNSNAMDAECIDCPIVGLANQAKRALGGGSAS